jgi:eukaryotic-like serine/threonine-protein kinase
MPPFAKTPDDPPEVGREFGDRYRIEAEIGQGGSGIVYRAIDRKLERAVALKLLRRDAVGPSQRPRFEREAKALAALTHPNIVAILDCGVSESVPYLVMELLEGESLAQALGSGPFPLERAERVVRELFSALAYMHAREVVHRDLKPGTVFLQRLPGGSEQVKLLDFGLAKFLDREVHGGDTLTRSFEVFGTPAYMPPEQWTGQPSDARADVYSAAAVCFEMLAGRKPFLGEGQELLRRQLIEAAPLLHEACPERVASPELERVLQRALARQACDRQRDATEIVAELEALPRPWVYSGVAATPERRSAALAVREALKVALAPTLEQSALAAAAAAPSDPSQRVDRTTVRPRALASGWAAVAALLRRMLVASAWTLTILSLLVIGIAAAVIYVLRSPAHLEQRAALERALPPVHDAVARGAAAAKNVVDDAVSDAKASVSAAFPSEAAAGSRSGPADSATRERARDPWRAPAPQQLRRLRARIDAGQRGDQRTLRELWRYNREHVDDPRGHLLLARLLVNRRAWDGAIAQYELAFARDPSSRGDPRMLHDLLRATGHETSSARAFELVSTIYGREALDAVERARQKARSPEERARLDRLARAVSR